MRPWPWPTDPLSTLQLIHNLAKSWGSNKPYTYSVWRLVSGVAFTDLKSTADEHGGRFTYLVPTQIQYLDRVVRPCISHKPNYIRYVNPVLHSKTLPCRFRESADSCHVGRVVATTGVTKVSSREKYPRQKLSPTVKFMFAATAVAAANKVSHCLLPVKNYPKLKIMLPAAATTIGVAYASSLSTPHRPKNSLLWSLCAADARSVCDS